jgi:hypothetical protein
MKMDLQEVGFGVVDRIDMSQDRDRWRIVVDNIKNLRVPLNAENFWTSRGTVSILKKGSAAWNELAFTSNFYAVRRLS